MWLADLKRDKYKSTVLSAKSHLLLSISIFIFLFVLSSFSLISTASAQKTVFIDNMRFTFLENTYTHNETQFIQLYVNDSNGPIAANLTIMQPDSTIFLMNTTTFDNDNGYRFYPNITQLGNYSFNLSMTNGLNQVTNFTNYNFTLHSKPPIVHWYSVTRALLNSTANSQINIYLRNWQLIKNITAFIQNTTGSYNITYNYLRLDNCACLSNNMETATITLNFTLPETIPKELEYNLTIIVHDIFNATTMLPKIRVMKLPDYLQYTQTGMWNQTCQCYRTPYPTFSSTERIVTTDLYSMTNVSLMIKINNSNTPDTSGFKTYLFNKSTSSASGLVALNKYVLIDWNWIEPYIEWVLINITYSDAEVSASSIDENSLKVYFYNDTSSQWEISGSGGCDTIKNYCYVNTTHFSQWGIFENKTSTSPSQPSTPPSSSSSSGGSSGGSSSGGSSGSGFGGGGGGGSTNNWGTISSEGISNDVISGNKYSFDIEDIRHTLILESSNSTTAVFEITSTPINVTLNVNESKKIDFDDDNTYDLEIRLNSISGLKASVTLKSINEQSTAEQTTATALQEPATEINQEENTTTITIVEEHKPITGFVVLPTQTVGIALIIVVAIAGFLVLKKSNTSKKKYRRRN